MDTQAQKLELIEWLSGLKDQNIIETLQLIKDNISSKSDWWNSISEMEKKSIDRGLKDIEDGKVISHSDL